MKIRSLATGLIVSLIATTTFAQKAELANANENFMKYQKFKVLGGDAVGPSLKAAKEAIDKASANEKTATLPQTYALKGSIYAVLAVQDTVPATSAPLFTIAEEALKKAKEADTKGEFKANIDDAYRDLADSKRNEGVNDYRAKKYELAYNAFERYRQIRPDDTDAMYFTALSASLANKNAEAIVNYNRLLETKYSRNPSIYSDLSNLYLNQKDTVAAAKYISDGVAKYPANAELRKRQIEFLLQAKKQNEAVDSIQKAIANDPKNKVLYYYGGFTYMSLANVIDGAQRKIKDQAQKDKMEQEKLEDFAKAAELYKKAIDIDPAYFECILNLGYVTMKPGIDLFLAAQDLPMSKKAEYNAMLAKSASALDAAKPYLLKAVEMRPKSLDALTNLKALYIAKQDNAGAADIQKKMDAVK